MAVDAESKKQEKKPYHPPSLKSYGSVAELTRGPKPSAHKDGSKFTGKSY